MFDFNYPIYLLFAIYFMFDFNYPIYLLFAIYFILYSFTILIF